MKVGTFKDHPIYVSDRKFKKYYAIVGNRKIYFGDSRYQQYHDKMGHYANLDHHDKKRQKRYKMRHEKDRHIKFSAGWFADKILW